MTSDLRGMWCCNCWTQVHGVAREEGLTRADLLAESRLQLTTGGTRVVAQNGEA